MLKIKGKLYSELEGEDQYILLCPLMFCFDEHDNLDIRNIHSEQAMQ